MCVDYVVYFCLVLGSVVFLIKFTDSACARWVCPQENSGLMDFIDLKEGL